MNYNIGRLKSQLRRHEGLRLKAYQDSLGVWTIGFGRNLQTMTISEYEADKWLTSDIFSAAEALENTFPIVNQLSEKRQRVLINMCFNLGIHGLSKFKKMWRAIERKEYFVAAGEMRDSLWFSQVGARAEELARMMENG